MDREGKLVVFGETQIIDSKTLAERWSVPESWIRKHTWDGTPDPIPHLKLGRYVRFEWGTEALQKWLQRRRST